MHLNCLFLKSGVRGMLEVKEFRVVNMAFPIIEAHVDRATRFKNHENMTGAHCMYSDMVCKEVSQNYGREWFLIGREKGCKGFCANKK